jgi:hypothetical protein
VEHGALDGLSVTADALLTAARALHADAPTYGEVVDAAVEGRRWWLAEWPAGAEVLLCLLAQDVQEVVHETRDPLWPRCPEHQDHPLLVEPDLGPDPFWVCHRTGLPVAQVGELPHHPIG